MPLPAALKWARLMPSDSVQSSEALSFGPATTTAFAIEHRRFSQVFIPLFRPLNVFEKVGELAVATVRANYRCPALIGVGVAVSNAALILHRRRTGRIRENYMALQAKLQYEKDSGQLIELTAAEEVLFNAFRQQRDAWLNWPSRVAPLMAADLDVPADRMTEVLIEHVHKHISVLGEPEFNPAED